METEVRDSQIIGIGPYIAKYGQVVISETGITVTGFTFYGMNLNEGARAALEWAIKQLTDGREDPQ